MAFGAELARVIDVKHIRRGMTTIHIQRFLHKGDLCRARISSYGTTQAGDCRGKSKNHPPEIRKGE
jgi:hypothetical protein